MIRLWPLVITAGFYIVIDLDVETILIYATQNIFQRQLSKTLMHITVMILVLPSVILLSIFFLILFYCYFAGMWILYKLVSM